MGYLTCCVPSVKRYDKSICSVGRDSFALHTVSACSQGAAGAAGSPGLVQWLVDHKSQCKVVVAG